MKALGPPPTAGGTNRDTFTCGPATGDCTAILIVTSTAKGMVVSFDYVLDEDTIRRELHAGELVVFK